MFEILKPGTEVGIAVPGKECIEGVVLGVWITDNVRVEVAWFSGGQRYSAWFNEFELRQFRRTEKSRIGFKSSPNAQDAR